MKKIFKCSVGECDKTYACEAILKRHILAFHSSVNKFQCGVCKKSLASRQNLKEHMFIHTREKPYVCPEPGCFMSFRQGTHLSAHKKLHQKKAFNLNIQKLYECSWCQEHYEDMPVKNLDYKLPAFIHVPSLAPLPSVF
ncbi:hypothetical protein SteCoe_18901 [Stentor coeruleus]|uniref:C2H2-type domain-containing protein n=1 Tax=Stentor coeruleus TaxID=5963 RepID=A0A1R2BVE9_9CILI|nr:hypothetical protein SteCoe_18901 [Stentor coeruleus]